VNTDDVVRLATQLYESLATGDRERLGQLLADDVELHAAEGLPGGLGGHHIGAPAARRFWREIGRAFDVRIAPAEFHPLDDGQGVAVIGRYVGTARATGDELDAAFVHVMTFRDDRLERLVQTTDTHRWHRAAARDGA